MKLELILLLVALLPVALRLWLGWRHGATVECRQLLAALFALLVALRYWYLTAATVGGVLPFDPQYVAPVAFVVLFLVAWMVAALVVHLRGEVFRSVQANLVDHILGALTGLATGVIWGGAFLLLATIALPGKVDGFSADALQLRLDKLPVATFRVLEQYGAGVAATDEAHTPFPEVEPTADPSGKPTGLIWK